MVNINNSSNLKSHGDFYQWINENISIVHLMKQYGFFSQDYPVESDISIFCPFHDNTNTKAARLYLSTNSMYCFSEQRAYYPVNFLFTFGKYSFNDLWSMYGQAYMEHKRAMDSLGLSVLSSNPVNMSPNKLIQEEIYSKYFDDIESDERSSQYRNNDSSFRDLGLLLDSICFGDMFKEE